MIGSKGLGRVRRLASSAPADDQMVGVGYHHMGTTRMSDSADAGVVDSDGRCWDRDNLYIAGSSALWVKVDCTAALGTVVLLDGDVLPAHVHPDLVTARIPHYAALTTGEHPIALHDPASGETLHVGSLIVH